MDRLLTVQILADADTGEVLAYLRARPFTAAYVRGLVFDNGVSAAQNRGDFYGCRDGEGRLRGVALIGDAILLEADDDAAIRAFASFARGLAYPRLIRGERAPVETFWHVYAGGASLPPTHNLESLLVRRAPVPECAPVPGLRAATPDDLPLLAEVNAQLACAEGGENPLERDPEGFRRRLALRVGRGRVWILREGSRVVFKTDVMAATPQATYIEGVYVAPEERGKGYGLRCLSRVGGTLLESSESVCLTVKCENEAAGGLYRKAGYESAGEYVTIYLKRAGRQVAA